MRGQGAPGEVIAGLGRRRGGSGGWLLRGWWLQARRLRYGLSQLLLMQARLRYTPASTPIVARTMAGILSEGDWHLAPQDRGNG